MKKLVTTLVLCAASGLATASNIKTLSVDSFEALDMDQDGIVTLQEAASSASLAGVFAAIDVDGNQQLTREEYRQYLASMAKKSG